MKKIAFALMAVAAITLASCLGKTATPGQGDPQQEAPADAKDLPAALQSLLNAGNGEGLFALVGNIQEKAIALIKDNPEKAKEYLSTAQKFLKDNAAQVSELVGKIGNTELAGRAQELIQSVSSQPVDQLLGVVGAAQDKVDAVKDAAQDQVDAVKDAVQDKVDAVKDAAQDKVDAVKEAAQDKADELKNAAKDAVDKLPSLPR